jgi:hypothetical protein
LAQVVYLVAAAAQRAAGRSLASSAAVLVKCDTRRRSGLDGITLFLFI